MSSPQGCVSLRVLRQMLTVGSYTALVKLVGGVKVVFTARAFGMSDGLDAYLIAFLLPSFVCDTLAGSLQSALVPTFIEIRERDGRASSIRLYQTVLGASAAVLFFAALLTGISAPLIFRLLASSFDSQKLALTQSLFWIMLPIVPVSAFGMTWRAMLNVEGRFAVPAMIPAVTPIAALIFLLAFGRTWGVYSLAAGTLAGGTLEAILLSISMLARGFPILPIWQGRSAALHQVVTQYTPVVAGILLLGGAPLIDQAIAGMLMSGSVAALSYGTRLSTVLIAIGPTAVATAILPHFSKLTVTADWTNIRHSLRSYAIVILAVSVPVVAVLIFFSEPIVRLFFQRGEFTDSATSVVTTIQRFSLIQIPIAMVMALSLRLVSSLKANHLLLRVAALYAVLNLALDLILTRTMGVAGIALSTAIVQFACLIYLFHLMRTHLPASLNPVPSRVTASS
ncbi:MAG TPA: lipid II flippase MurJ [Bryobacteraceae bacterium]|nr:lipid II flippase MurJ [Bryobacteraceae bacterium]